MPYLLFKPCRPPSLWHSDPPSNPATPSYATRDGAVSQVFHSYGWFVLRAPRLPSTYESSIRRDSNTNDDQDNEATERDDISSIRQCSGLTELHHQTVAIEGLVEGP
jgi:hypothetical protein